MSKLLLDFPEGYEPREAQVEILKKVEKAIDSGKKFVIINAPTGIGKSLLAKTLGNYSNSPSDAFVGRVNDYSIYGEDGPEYMQEEDPFGCFALTITKSLQDQYQSSFEGTGMLKGKGNYQCEVDDEFTVDVAPCVFTPTLKKECWASNLCPYYNDRNSMLTKKFSTLNYSMYFSLPNHLKKRQILVCDEGSELEEQLVSQFTTEVDIPFLIKSNIMVSAFPTQTNPTKIMCWLEKLVVELEGGVVDLKTFLSKKENMKDIMDYNKKKTTYSKLDTLLQNIKTLSSTYYDAEYLIEKVDNKIKFIPLKVDVLSKYLFGKAELVVILSATIINYKNYVKNLGIDNYEYIEVDGSFDPKKSPIYVMAKQKLNYKNLKEMLPKISEQVEGILEHHENDMGIIHTHTQYITDFLRERIGDSRMLYRQPGVTNEDLLREHFSSNEPTILVSPSMTYGVDLHGKFGKLQILLKAPWLPTKEVRVEKLMKTDKDWYSEQMLKTLVQACGRSVRSEDDECDTYILDGSIFDAVSRNRKKLPKFFLDRFQ